MTAPDTSVLLAGFDSSHPFHEQAQEALGEVRRQGRLIAHTIAETFAVLTTAGPYGLAGATVLAYLERFLDREPIGLEPTAYVRALAELAHVDLVGGAVYDTLIALASRSRRGSDAGQSRSPCGRDVPPMPRAVRARAALTVAGQASAFRNCAGGLNPGE